MDAMTADTPDLQGIRITGVAHDGGDIRKITDLGDFIDSHYYYQGYNVQKQCRDTREQPIIYNYGGRPDAIAIQGDTYVLSLFKMEPGTGDSREPGIDCSGYVATSMAAGGVRLRAGEDISADDILGINTYQFMEADLHGYNCLAKASMGMSGTLRAGDIVVMPGHMVIVDTVGDDPLSVNKVTDEDDCDNIKSEDFDFVMIQSSSIKNGIGLNRYKGADLLQEIDNFRLGLVSMAKQACHAKFTQKNLKPYYPKLNVLRVREARACLQDSISLVGQRCVEHCVR